MSFFIFVSSFKFGRKGTTKIWNMQEKIRKIDKLLRIVHKSSLKQQPIGGVIVC